MTYIVLARKYRPQKFSDVIGQQHVTRTLANAFEMDRVHHAFLFTGARGVGKTSCARILAKALNCDQGMQADPCGECASCTEIVSGQSVDVFEIDGASNTSVDNVRELRERARYVPASGRYKVYIIDEVHMLSDSAFNALLKTLEEPPPHVKFIFATTEPHKIPVTILSRCQRFDFRRVPPATIADHLGKMVAAEGVKIAETSLLQIAQAAEGSVRDAQSLLDQLISFAGSEISEDAVVEVLGLTDRATLRDLARAILEGDAASTLRVVEQTFRHGRDMLQLGADIQRLLRDLAVAKLGKGEADDLLDMGKAEGEVLRNVAGDAGSDQLLRLYDVFARSMQQLQQATSPRLALEMALLKLVYMEPLVPLDTLVRRLEDLESGGAAPRGTGGGGSGGARRQGGTARSARADDGSQGSAAPPAQQDASPGFIPESEAQTSATVAVRSDAGPVRTEANEAASYGEAEWRSLVEAVRGHRPFLAATLEHGAVVEINRRRLVVAFREGTDVGEQARIALTDAAHELLGPAVVVQFTRLRREVSAGDSLAAVDKRRAEEDQGERRTRAKQHPIVRDVLQVFEVSDPAAIKARVEE